MTLRKADQAATQLEEARRRGDAVDCRNPPEVGELATKDRNGQKRVGRSLCIVLTPFCAMGNIDDN